LMSAWYLVHSFLML